MLRMGAGALLATALPATQAADEAEKVRMRYRDPNWTKSHVVQEREQSLYRESPLDLQLKMEEEWFKANRDPLHTLKTIADAIANRAAEAQLARVQQQKPAATMEEALRHAHSSPKEFDCYMKLIAAEIVASGCRIGVSHVFATDFQNESRGQYCVDCDLISMLFLHCAWRHDQPLQAMDAPEHMYIASSLFPECVYEPTCIHYPDRFFLSSEKEQRRKHFFPATKPEIHRLYEPVNTDEDMAANALSCILIQKCFAAFGNTSTLSDGHIDKLNAMLERAEEMHTTRHSLPMQAYYIHFAIRRHFVNTWRLSGDEQARIDALTHAKKMRWWKDRYPHLMCYPDHQDDAILSALLNRQNPPIENPQLVWQRNLSYRVSENVR